MAGGDFISSFPLSGIRNAKLEGVACFGCNVIALIEAQIAEEDERPATGVQSSVVVRQPGAGNTLSRPYMRLSRKLTERRRCVGF